jgi:hypothetical protein
MNKKYNFIINLLIIQNIQYSIQTILEILEDKEKDLCPNLSLEL